MIYLSKHLSYNDNRLPIQGMSERNAMPALASLIAKLSFYKFGIN